MVIFDAPTNESGDTEYPGVTVVTDREGVIEAFKKINK